MAENITSREIYLASHQIKTAMYGAVILDEVCDFLPEPEKSSLPNDFRQMLRTGLEYHDISKTLENGWTEDFLFGARHPTKEEWEKVIIPHPVQAACMMFQRGIKDRLIIEIVLYHHVRFDGVCSSSFSSRGRTFPPYSGYPAGVKGEKRHIGQRIAKLADAVSAMDEDRPYRSRKIPMEEIREIVMERSGNEYCPVAVAAFCYAPLDTLLRVSEYIIPHERIMRNIQTRNNSWKVQ